MENLVQYKMKTFLQYIFERVSKSDLDQIEKYADRAIFICEHNKNVLGTQKGEVIYNPVSLEKYKNRLKHYINFVHDEIPSIIFPLYTIS